MQLQVSIPYYTGAATDVITNTWHFLSLDGEPVSAGRCQLAAANLKLFYDGIMPNNTQGQWAPWVRPALSTYKCFDLDDPQPRTAVYEGALVLGGSQATSAYTMPEVAVCLSYRTEYQSGISKASQRGRIYLGGLADTCFDAGANAQFPITKTIFRANVASRATALCADSIADDWGWVVYSRKLDDSYAVAGGWIDNASDTQRRRGQASTGRQLWTD